MKVWKAVFSSYWGRSMKIMTFVLAISLIALPAHADEKKSPHPLMTLGLLEGMALINSGAAAFVPKLWGTIELVGIPLAAANSRWDLHHWSNLVSVMGLTGIGAYNAFLHKKDLSKASLFAHNMIGWHATMAAVFAVQFLFERDKHNDKETDKGKKIEVSLAPRENGGHLLAQYRF